MTKLVYGCGLRLRESVKLRIKDVDFRRNYVTIREGKGDKDRETFLPVAAKSELQHQIKYSKRCFDADRKDNVVVEWPPRQVYIGPQITDYVLMDYRQV